MINCCTKHAMLTQSCWTVCPGEDNESKSRCHKRHSTGKKKKKKKRRRKGEENSSDYDSEFVLKQRDSKCGQSLSPSRRVELPDIIPKQVKKRKLHTHTLFFRIPVSLYTESRNVQGRGHTGNLCSAWRLYCWAAAAHSPVSQRQPSLCDIWWWFRKNK